MGLFSRLFRGRKGRKGEVLRKEALGRAALLATRPGPSRWLAEGIVRTHCETIAATRGISAEEVWAEFSAHLDMDELGAIYASKIPDELEQRAETGDPQARREYVAIVTAELRDALERHGATRDLAVCVALSAICDKRGIRLLALSGRLRGYALLPLRADRALPLSALALSGPTSRAEHR